MHLKLLEFVRVDEMEGIFPDRQKTHSEYKKEDTGVFLTQKNYLKRFNAKNLNRQVRVLGATNHPGHLDSAVW